MSEEWRDAVGFEGFYKISSLGNLRRKGKTKNMVLVPDRDGYLRTMLSCAGVRKNVMAHILVAAAFHGPCPNGYVIRHKDGITFHNDKTNLTYGTPADNSADMVAHGTQAKGTKHHFSKLNEIAVLEIRASSASNAELGAIWFVKRKRTWKHV